MSSRPSSDRMSHSTPLALSSSTPTSPIRLCSTRRPQILRQGGLVAFATETVYGLGAIATDPEAVSRIFAAKERPAINPVIVHVASVAQAAECVADWPATAQTPGRAFWPGPLTLVLSRVRESSPIK